jgi:hypothetical protein
MINIIELLNRYEQTAFLILFRPSLLFKWLNDIILKILTNHHTSFGESRPPSLVFYLALRHNANICGVFKKFPKFIFKYLPILKEFIEYYPLPNSPLAQKCISPTAISTSGSTV